MARIYSQLAAAIGAVGLLVTSAFAQSIPQLPPATTPLTGNELVPLWQSGATKNATVNSIRGSGAAVTLGGNNAFTGNNSFAGNTTFTTDPTVSSGGSTTTGAIFFGSNLGSRYIGWDPTTGGTGGYSLGSTFGSADTLYSGPHAINNGSSSQVKLAAPSSGVWTLTLPSSGGTNGYVLSTDGAGNTSWIANGSGGSAGLTNTYDITASAYGCTKSTATSGADQTPCIQSAINAAATAGGGVVWIPSGFWNLKSQLLLKKNVTIQCVSNGYLFDASTESYSNATTGSVFSVLWGNGTGNSNNATYAAIKMQQDSAVKDCGFWYPNQSNTATTPTEYGSTLLVYDASANVHQTATGNWCANCYNFLDWRGGISGIGMAGAYISNNTGSPINYGIAINFMDDWGTIQNNHFNSGAINQGDTTGTYLRGWIQNNGIAFYVGHSDWVLLDHDEAYGYKVGVYTDFNTSCCGAYTSSGPVILQNSQLDAMSLADIYTSGTIMNLRILGGTGTAFNAYTLAQGVFLAGTSTTNIASLQLDGVYTFATMQNVVNLTATGTTIGNVSITNVHSTGAASSQYAYQFNGGTSIYISGSTYTGYSGGLLYTSGSWTNPPVLIGDFQ